MEYCIVLGIGFIAGWGVSFLSSKQGANQVQSAILTITKPIELEEEVVEENMEGLYDFQQYEDYAAYLSNFGLPGQEEINEEPDNEEFEELK